MYNSANSKKKKMVRYNVGIEIMYVSTCSAATYMYVLHAFNIVHAALSRGSIPLGEVDSVLSLQAQKKFKSSRHMSSEEKEVFREIRRQSHISAEQKRRGSIKVWACDVC